MNISIFGTGYVGLVTGACLADAGHDVLCMDIDARKVEGLQAGVVPIYEPGLSGLIARTSADGRLAFTTDAAAAVAHGEMLFIAVGTPQDEDGSADLSYVLAVAKSIGQHMSEARIIVDKSTVPVGTAERVAEAIATELRARGAEVPFEVCSNPEFLKEGSAIEDFSRAARIIVGTDSEEVRGKMRELYAPYNRNHEKLMFMDVRAAELTKYAANAMLATKISFINEMANLADRLGVDIEQVRRGIGSDPRIGYHFIYAGAGYGGSCFPKDVQALIRSAGDAGYEPDLLRAVESVNERQKQTLFDKLSAAFGGQLKGRTIAIWGLAFKPDTDDMRNAPSRTLMERLWAAGAHVRAYDPAAMPETARIYGERPDLVLAANREAAVEGADALVICTEWKAFRTVDFRWLKSRLRHPLVIDGRNLWEPDTVAARGIDYVGIGRRGPAAPTT